MKSLFSLLGLTICFLSAGTAFSTITVVDQQNLNNEGTLTPVLTPLGAGYGQSFTPSLPSLNAVDVIIFVPTGSNTTLQMELFTGSGLGLPVVGLTMPITIAPTPNAQLVEFIFPQPLVVTPGLTYTFTILRPSGNGYAVQYGSDTYAGGNMFDPQFIYPQNDLWFIEGLAVPEPSSLALLSIGAMSGLIAICRRLASLSVQDWVSAFLIL